jgi:hypothetical protein
MNDTNSFDFHHDQELDPTTNPQYNYKSKDVTSLRNTANMGLTAV